MPRERDLFTPAWRKSEQRLEAVEIALVIAIAVIGFGVLLLRNPDLPAVPAPATLEAPR